MIKRKRALRTHVLLIGAAAFGISACQEDEAKLRLYQDEASCEASNSDCETVTLEDGTNVAVAVIGGMIAAELIDEIGDSLEKSRKKNLRKDGDSYVPPFVSVPRTAYNKALPAKPKASVRSLSSTTSRGGFGGSRTASGSRSSFGG